MLTTLFYHWCEFRFISIGIPCPPISIFGRRHQAVKPRLLKKNQTGITLRFQSELGNLISIGEEWTKGGS